MKNEEAIVAIDSAKAEVEWAYPMEYAVAFDMAIEALKKESMCNEILNDVVHCKNCKYSYGTPSRMYCGRYGYNDKMFVREDGFCDRGERENEEKSSTTY